MDARCLVPEAGTKDLPGDDARVYSEALWSGGLSWAGGGRGSVDSTHPIPEYAYLDLDGGEFGLPGPVDGEFYRSGTFSLFPYAADGRSHAEWHFDADGGSVLVRTAGAMDETTLRSGLGRLLAALLG